MKINKTHLINLSLLTVIILLTPILFFVEEKNRFFNYLITAFAALFIILFPFPKIKKKLLFIHAFIIAILIINIVFAPIKNFKWFINQTIFIGLSFYLSLLYSEMNEKELLNLKKFISRMLKVSSVFVLLIALWGVFTSGKYFPALFGQATFNSFLFTFDKTLAWKKQTIGNYLGLTVAWILASRTIHPLLITPLAILSTGIRTFFLSTTALIVFYYRKILAILILFSPVILVGVYSFITSILLDKSFYLNIRLLSYINALNIIKQYPFGIGLGNYSTYIETKVDYIPQTLGYLSKEFSFIPTATESDLVTIFSSLGLTFGIVFSILLASIALKAIKNVRSLTTVDQFFVNFLLYLFCSGITQDNMFTLVYWIIFGLSLGALYKEPE